MVEVKGVGLHTGQLGTVRLHREAGPVRFRLGKSEFRPLASRVVHTQRCTTLGIDAYQIMTVEHLLAALFIRGIWQGLVIEAVGPEVPILDGSAKEWLVALEGFPAAGPQAVLLPDVIRLEQKGSSVLAQPAQGFALTATIAFPHPKIGYQQVSCPPLSLGELAPARTFGFLKDLERLRARGLALGASAENALVFGDHEPLSPARMLGEPVRHKALDFLGDLYLAGLPLQGNFTVHRGSHGLHVALAGKLEAFLTDADKQ